MQSKSIRISLKPGMLLTMAAAFVSLLAQVPCRAQSLQVDVAVDKMLCIRPTETGLNNRDEVYMIVKTQAPGGHGAQRLPHPDDYYEFWKGTQGEVRGWTNQNQQKQGAPPLFHGILAPGQSASVFVVIGEQDNKDLAAIGRTVLKIAEIAVSVVADAFDEPEIGTAASGVLQKMSDAIHDNHDDQIGSFSLVVKNENGKLREVWVPGKFTSKQGESGAFACRGTSNSAYNLHVQVASRIPTLIPGAGKLLEGGTPPAKHRTYLGTEIDRCGETILKVPGLEGTVEIRKGETKEVHVHAKRFWWYCANSQEWTTAPDGTNLVVVTRGVDDRKITWKCYHEE